MLSRQESEIDKYVIGSDTSTMIKEVYNNRNERKTVYTVRSRSSDILNKILCMLDEFRVRKKSPGLGNTHLIEILLVGAFHL